MLKKGLKITLVVVVALIAVAVGAFYFLQSRAANELRSRINNHLAEGVHFDFRQLDFDLVDGNFVLHDMTLSSESKDTLRWILEAGKVKITGFNYQYSDGEHGISAATFELHEPHAHIHVRQPSFKLFESDTLSESAGKQRLGFLSIDTLFIKGGRVDFRPEGTEEAWGHFEAGMGGLYFTPADQIANWSSASLGLSDLGYQLSNGLYVLRVAQVDVDWNDRGAEVHGFSMKSTLSKEAFQNHFGHRKSRIDLEVPYLHMAGFSMDSADTYHLKVLRFGNTSLLLSRDNSLPLPDRVTKLPQTMLDELPIRFRLGQFKVDNATIDVELKGKRSQELEKLSFTEVQVDLKNIQNVDHSQSALAGGAKGMFMNDTELKVDLTYSYGPGDPWYLRAVAGNFDMMKLNELMESEVGMKLSSGHMAELFMTLEGDNDVLEGELIFHYEDLAIALAEDRREESSIFYRYLVEGVGKLFYRRDNPEKRDSRSAEFSVERDVRKDFVGQWIDGLTEGMLITVSKIDTFTTMEKRKERQLKKTAKLERREARKADKE